MSMRPKAQKGRAIGTRLAQAFGISDFQAPQLHRDIQRRKLGMRGTEGLCNRFVLGGQ